MSSGAAPEGEPMGAAEVEAPHAASPSLLQPLDVPQPSSGVRRLARQLPRPAGPMTIGAGCHAGACAAMRAAPSPL
jgi:hypothetical protein